MEDLVKIKILDEENFDINKTYILVEEEEYQRVMALAVKNMTVFEN